MAGTKNILNTVSILKYSWFFFIGLLFYSHSNYYTYAVDLSLPSLEGTYNYWNVFTITQNNGKICYLVSSPIGSTGNYTDIRKPYIMVSLFGYNKVEVSINAGFLYKLNSIVSVSIDGKQERFIAETDTLAWVEKFGTDKKIVKNLISGNKLLVFYQSYDRTYAVDTYSLIGFSKAYNLAKQLCNRV